MYIKTDQLYVIDLYKASHNSVSCYKTLINQFIYSTMNISLPSYNPNYFNEISYKSIAYIGYGLNSLIF